jgi:hypothetical protein
MDNELSASPKMDDRLTLVDWLERHSKLRKEGDPWPVVGLEDREWQQIISALHQDSPGGVLYEWLTKCGWVVFQYRTDRIYPNSLSSNSCRGVELTEKIKLAMEDQLDGARK